MARITPIYDNYPQSGPFVPTRIPSQYDPQPAPQQPVAAPAQPAPAANPLQSLNEILGTNIGGQPQNLATKQAVGTMTPTAQMGASLAMNREQVQAAQIAAAMAERGGFPNASMPAWQQQQQQGVAEAIYNQMASGKPAAPQPIHAYAPTGLRQQALAANGQEVQGIGDVMVSAAPNGQGGTGFNLRQISRPAQGVATLPVNGPAAVPLPDGQGYDLMTGIEQMRAQAAAAGQTPSTAGMYAGQPQPAPAAPVADSPINSGTPEQSPVDRAYAQYQSAVNGAGAKPALKLEPGYMVDPSNPGSVIPIPGSKAEQDRNATVSAANEKNTQAIDQSNTVIRTVNQILPQLNAMTTGPIAAITELVPGTPAYQVKSLRDTVVANVGLSQLRAMRDASKNGASGMGQLSEKELDVLQNALGNLKLAQNTQQVAKAMRDVRNGFYRWRSSHMAGQLDANNPAQAERIRAVKWALANPKDARAEQILAMDGN